MVDFTSTQVQAKEVAPPANRKGVQDEADAAKPLSASPPLTADGVDKMYHQLTEIHAVGLTQLLARLRPGPVDRGPSRHHP
jgi:hypothetical protein